MIPILTPTRNERVHSVGVKSSFFEQNEYHPKISVCLSLSESYVAWFTFSPRSTSLTVLRNFAVRKYPENIEFYQTCQFTLHFPVDLADWRRIHSPGRKHRRPMGRFHQLTVGKSRFLAHCWERTIIKIFSRLINITSIC